MAFEPPLAPGDDAFPHHVFDALGAPPHPLEERIGGSVMVVEKRPDGGPVTLITAGASRLPVDAGLPVELAVEVPDGQQGAALVALRIVCDDIATHRRTPPMGAPWRNGTPFLVGTRIAAILATTSRWGAAFDDVRGPDGAVVGHVRTLRLLTDGEAAVVVDRGWDALLATVGSPDALLDVTRDGAATAAEPGATAAAPDPAPPTRGVIMTTMHAQYPPRWLTLSRGMFQSVTGGESPEYMADNANHEIVSLDAYVARFPWTESFTREASEGQTARFSDDSGRYDLEP